MPVLSIRIVLDCFYLLIFYSEKFSTHVCRSPQTRIFISLIAYNYGKLIYCCDIN